MKSRSVVVDRPEITVRRRQVRRWFFVTFRRRPGGHRDLTQWESVLLQESEGYIGIVLFVHVCSYISLALSIISVRLTSFVTLTAFVTVAVWY